MIFYIYLDPDVLSVNNLANDFAMQALIGALRGFTQNCCIAEFEDYRVQDAIKEQVKNLPDTYERKLVKKLLAAIAKRNRFIYCLARIIPEQKQIFPALQSKLPTVCWISFFFQRPTEIRRFQENSKRQLYQPTSLRILKMSDPTWRLTVEPLSVGNSMKRTSWTSVSKK
jgi:hypothetical protein